MSKDKSTLSFAAALNAALADEMSSDEMVVVFGEDVGTLGGVFRITEGLSQQFGEDRCFDTPLAESGIAGTAIGMGLGGVRPVIEMQFDAFAYPAFQQIVSHMAKMRNRTKGAASLPITVRIPYGGGIGGVEHHCDSSESYYAHTPGLKVYTPASVEDAYLMLRAAIRLDDPVIFMEPKKLYWSKAEISLEELRQEFNTRWAQVEAQREHGEPYARAGVARTGEDVTLVSYGPSVVTCLAAAEAAAKEGRSVEVIDLRTINPLDEATITASVTKTGRAIVVAEPQGFTSVASEVVARIQQRCFHSLAAPVLRVTGFDIPYPPPMLEKYHLPNVDRILDAIDDLQWDDTPVDFSTTSTAGGH
ncbi:MAG: alpha-ketoacid dehydrogenase subunit beta [Yaniella sp.]|uniref:alpha-ketoacid dehydrogenase subunit beta n=2 Tax=Yaniella sp. TaxID=2773929 RepID=UPI0026498F7B|nr:alpha-ketoacid dehydrogenase subunit beta [Yaniella sp.]MDN5732572.1 alpha-ketoacid dehydrogenase subunit beta [Yaniella sp.]MDN5817510.1 alpha-ketoacid dehydrogenase subunit beta [Yaniella sp.]MDN5888868.1 alpha-ketoacid dehydrogenase subunit beta [Yaniella sp.]MDN6148378.1 alpha-ketoacid dehydrogenase subunit beta [Yaniella sp.]MDN6150828.1 alpha-ketoacid dehydrogenase subunit beta [Yaniella sp.]